MARQIQPDPSISSFLEQDHECPVCEEVQLLITIFRHLEYHKETENFSKVTLEGGPLNMACGKNGLESTPWNSDFPVDEGVVNGQGEGDGEEQNRLAAESFQDEDPIKSSPSQPK